MEERKMVSITCTDFFKKIIDCDHLIEKYPEFYTIYNIPFNNNKICQIYNKIGIFLNHTYNKHLHFFDFNVITSSKMFEKYNIYQIVDIIFKLETPIDICYESYNKSENEDDIFEFEDDYITKAFEEMEYHFFVDVFDVNFYRKNNKHIIQKGFIGIKGAINHYIEHGIYENIPYNRFGNTLNLKHMKRLNHLNLLNSEKETLCFFIEYGCRNKNFVIDTDKSPSHITSNQINSIIEPKEKSNDVVVKEILDDFLKYNKKEKYMSNTRTIPKKNAEPFLFSGVSVASPSIHSIKY